MSAARHGLGRADGARVKPNVAKETLCLPGMKEALAGKLLISICGGVTISQMRTWLDESTLIVRAMPNVASKASPSTFLQSPGTDFGQIREGMTVITPVADAHRRALILAIFTSCGRARILEEKHFDACTALAGSGPAFVALVLEAMVDGGVMMGLPRVEAMEIAAQSELVGLLRGNIRLNAAALQGTGRMALQTGMHPAQLKDSVTSAGYAFVIERMLTAVSTRGMHNSRLVDNGRRPGAVHYRSDHPGRHKSVCPLSLHWVAPV